ncbi:hypothetical protein K432DRAFT_388149 [Lepidopterella palustris CBS 459.81]|uniref:SAC3/GANP/THP3 conserved domain-containing protein n=1 Tax=Lepidopterella palustris CBS 459.81 TaxID=1314670 RepID=A0A8E2EL26_9PEZI|nr:hypothetical protein K432DRAFT_388149 [Lepidopterella palustris CBS 459.81]
MSIPAVPWRQQAPPPAYHTVPTQRTLVKPEPKMAAPVSNPPRKVAWPQSVRDYVQRSFAPEAFVQGIDRAEMERKLKDIINEAAEDKALNDVDWENHPLPQEIILQERKAALAVDENRMAWINGSAYDQATPVNGHTNLSSLSPSPKKRKSPDIPLSEHADDALPPWRKTNNHNVFEARITYANQGQADRVDKRQRKNKDKDNFIAQGSSKFSQAELEKRKARFQAPKSGNQSTPPWIPSRVDSDNEFSAGPVVGTCQELEKKYFRLTAPPKPETVRPLVVLEQTLELLKKKWRQENNYGYICDQFKSLRQDLTVQHIKNAFTVNVYEIHARIALEKGDLGEYNQCQTQLRALYSQNLGGNPAEFLAYRILYFIHTCNRTDMNDVLADLTPADKSQHAVQHALKVRSALAMGNYHRFFQLYLDAPNMGSYLMDMFIDRERLAALANICKAYKPDVKIRFLTEELGFESDPECIEFLTVHHAGDFLEQKSEPDGKLTLRMLTSKAGPLFDTLRSAAFSKVDIKGQI